jgi:8-oxo-dGTP pyrophosphatase MutT (NUDIX family)
MPTFNNKPNERVILPDGREVWLSRSVAVVVVLLAVRDGILHTAIEQRGKALDYPGRWCVPCGYIDRNETGPEAARREVYEEIGLDINDFKQILVSHLQQPWYVNTDPKENRQNITLRYGMCIDLGNNPLPDLHIDGIEVADAKWAYADDLSKYNFAFSHDTLIRKYVDLAQNSVKLLPSKGGTP